MKRMLLVCALLGLIAGCAGRREVARYDGPDSDIRPVIQLGHSGVAQAVALSPDDHLAVSGSADGILKFWEVSSGRLIYTSYHHLGQKAVAAIEGGNYGGITISPQVTFVDISATSDRLLSGASDGSVVISEIKTGRLMRVYHPHGKGVNAGSFSKDATLAVTGDAGGEK